MSELIDNMDREFEFWMANRTKEVTLSGRSYKVAVYNVEVDGPRPGSCYAGKKNRRYFFTKKFRFFLIPPFTAESYREDYRDAQKLPEGERLEFYMNMKSGAESGWDYSTKW